MENNETLKVCEHCLMAIESREGNQPTLKHYIDYNDWDEDAWLHILSEMKEATVLFWKRHGFDVEFKAR